MVKKIYIGNLPFSATEEEVRGLFEAHGEVSSVNLISDRETGRSPRERSQTPRGKAGRPRLAASESSLRPYLRDAVPAARLTGGQPRRGHPFPPPDIGNAAVLPVPRAPARPVPEACGRAPRPRGAQEGRPAPSVSCFPSP
jgi:hypothetical protein